MQLALMLVLGGALLLCIWAIIERLRNQKAVDNGAFKGIFLQKTGRARPLLCKLGRNTPEIPDTYKEKFAEYGVSVGWQEIVVPIPGVEEGSCPRYFTNKYATFTDRYPGGKGLWARVTSVDMPYTVWHAGNPIPAVARQPGEQAKEGRALMAEIMGHLRDESASANAMQAAHRNVKLEAQVNEALRSKLNPNHVLMGFAALIVTNIVAIYFMVQLQGDFNETTNELNAGIDGLRMLLGGGMQ